MLLDENSFGNREVYSQVSIGKRNYFMMKILDKYIFQELIDPFIFGLFSFSLILSASMIMFELVRAVVISGMPLFTALQIFIFRLPSVVVYIFPMATLLAALLGFSRLSKDSKWPRGQVTEL